MIGTVSPAAGVAGWEGREPPTYRSKCKASGGLLTRLQMGINDLGLYNLNVEVHGVDESAKRPVDRFLRVIIHMKAIGTQGFLIRVFAASNSSARHVRCIGQNSPSSTDGASRS